MKTNTSKRFQAGSVVLGLLVIGAVALALVAGCNITRKLNKMKPRTFPGDGDGTNTVSTLVSELQSECGPEALVAGTTFEFRTLLDPSTIIVDSTNLFAQVATRPDGPWADAENQDEAFKFFILSTTDVAMAREMVSTNLFFRTNSHLFFRLRLKLQ